MSKNRNKYTSKTPGYSDLKSRVEAIRINKSFIVRAPAGSGKTQLILTRFLKLVIKYKTPHTIYVTTFSIKANQELKDRFLDIISNADFASEHLLYKLAFLVKKDAEKYKWDLDNFNFFTIDSLAVHFLSPDLKQRRIIAEPFLVYKCIAESIFILAKTNQELNTSLQTIGKIYHYNYEKTLSFLISFLEHRVKFTDFINMSVTDNLDHFIELLIIYTYHYFMKDTKYFHEGLLPVPILSNLEAYKSLIKDFFTTEGVIKVRKRHLTNITHVDKIILLLLLIKCETQYDIHFINSLRYIFSSLEVKLKNYFQKHDLLDFPALYLNLYQIEAINHLLIDEFQDISLEQYRFITKISQAMSSANQDTLFFVGDPMQSIYKFRQADLNIFLNLSKFKLNSFELKELNLHTNFRSHELLVTSFNNIFNALMTHENNILLGQPQFQSAQARLKDAKEAHINIKSYENKESQYTSIILYILELLKDDSTKKIGILVRSRSSILGFTNVLKQHSIPYNSYLDNLYEQEGIDILCIMIILAINHESNYFWYLLLKSDIFNYKVEDIERILIDNWLNHEITIDDVDFKDTVLIVNHSQWDLKEKIMKFSSLLSKKYQSLPMFLPLFIPHILELYINVPVNKFFLVDFYHDVVSCLKKVKVGHSSNYPVSIMTIHQSKGLEFDAVILLQSQLSITHNQDLLISQESVFKDNRLLFVYGIKNTWAGQLISEFRKIRFSAETIRLLYVAVTRAKHCLLITYVKSSKQNRNSFIYLLRKSCSINE